MLSLRFSAFLYAVIQLLLLAAHVKGFLPRVGIAHRPSSSSLSMALYPIPNRAFVKLSPRRVTMEQWYAYWGTNKPERISKILESVLLAYGGMWFAWFISFMGGPLPASIVGTGMVFNWMYTPWLTSYRTNKTVWYAQKDSNKKLRHAVFTGRITRLRKIRRRTGR
jgi:hypothetical protein